MTASLEEIEATLATPCNMCTPALQSTWKCWCVTCGGSGLKRTCTFAMAYPLVPTDSAPPYLACEPLTPLEFTARFSEEKFKAQFDEQFYSQLC